MTNFHTIEEAAKTTNKSTRTIRRYIDKLDKDKYNSQVKIVKNKIYVSADFIDSFKGQNKIVNVKNVITKQNDVDDLKRQILRLEKKLDEKESELKLKEEKHIDDLKLFTSKVLYLEEEKSKDSSEAKSIIKKIEAEKNELLIQKAKLEERLESDKKNIQFEKSMFQERLESEKAKTSMSYFVAALLFVFLIVLFSMISLQVF
jgi:hypothetical protein